MKSYILGTDWWTDCDDVVAVRILARAHNKGEIKLSGVCINAAMEYSVASLDGFLRYEGAYDIPVGIDSAATDYGGRPPYQQMLAQRTAHCRSDAEAEQGVRFYRRLLAEADQKLELVEIGFLQVAAALLMSPSDDLSPLPGIELVKSKVAAYWVMGGKWDEDGGKEYNFCHTSRARSAANAFCRLCPVPVTFLGYEVGESVITGSHLDRGDLLYKAMEAQGSPCGRSSWDPMLVSLAIAGSPAKAGYTAVRGYADVDPDDGSNYFKRNPRGPHAYVVKKRSDTFYQRHIDGLIASK